MGFANKMPPGVSEGIFCAEHESGFKNLKKLIRFAWKLLPRGFWDRWLQIRLEKNRNGGLNMVVSVYKNCYSGVFGVADYKSD